MQDATYQTVAFTARDGSSGPTNLQLPGVAKLGVPRCSYSGLRVLLSALKNDGSNNWGLVSYDMTAQNWETVGDGFSFAGYAAWSADDSWATFLHKAPDDKYFHLIWLSWNPFTNFQIKVPASVVSEKYPAVSPANGTIAFACLSADKWNLCTTDSKGESFKMLLSSLSNLSGERSSPKKPVPAITPTWSPDGTWIAYASNKDGDWDIYLYSSIWEFEINLTQALGGDQFQPAWSKP